MVRRHGPAMIEAVKRGVADTVPLPSRKRDSAEKKPPHGGRETERLFQKLKNWRQELVARQNLPLAMSASNNQLKILAGWRPEDLKSLHELSDIRTWQVERYGKEWLKILGEFEQDQEKPSRRNPRNRRRSRRGARKGADKSDAS